MNLDKLVEAEAERRWPHSWQSSKKPFIEGANFYRSLLPEKVYRWVKASEVPVKVHNPCCRIMYNDMYMHFDGAIDEKGVYDINSEVGEINQSEVEWLEEIDLRNPSDKTNLQSQNENESINNEK